MKKLEDRVRKDDTTQSNYIIEIENRYLREIRTLNESFDVYKRSVDKQIMQLEIDCKEYKSRTDESEGII